MPFHKRLSVSLRNKFVLSFQLNAGMDTKIMVIVISPAIQFYDNGFIDLSQKNRNFNGNSSTR